MKKFLSLLLVIVMFATMTVGVGAYTTSYNSKNSAIDLTLGKYVSIMSNEIGAKTVGNNIYYKFTVPYASKVNIEFYAYCTYTDGKQEYPGELLTIDLSNTSTIISNLEFWSSHKHKADSEYSMGSINIVLDPGVYYLNLYTMYGTEKIYKYTIKTSFKCIHENYTDKVTEAPTCSSVGKEERNCNSCKSLVKTTTIRKLPHTPADEWVRVSEPTCSAKGEEQKSCTVCGGVADTQSLDKLPHTYGEWTADTEPTCSKVGERSRICSVCGDKDTETIDMLDHDFGDWERTTEPTCTVKGKETRECSTCGKSETNSLDMLEHSFSDWEVATEATCTSKGKEVRECSTCGKEETQSIDMLEHDFRAWEVYSSATCTSTGTEKRYCRNCSKSETRTIEKTDHEYDDWKVITKATCTSTGQEQGYCDRCGKTITEKIPMLDHEFGEWTVVTEATCTTKGKQTATCNVCGKTESKSIKKLDHDYGDWEVTTEPTCTKTGKQTHTCKVCGKTESETVDKAAHTVEEWTITKEATENKKGTRKGKCTVCDKSVTEKYEKYPGRDGFKKSRDYGNKFSDVGNDKWFHQYVQTAYEYELANGTSNTKFSPDNNFTVAQALTAAANIHSAYYGYDIASTESGDAWYTPYVNYCIDNNIIEQNQFSDYNKNITRGEMAIVFANILPLEEYESVRTGNAADMDESLPSFSAVEKLYCAGIVSGDANTGNFRPNDEIVRSEACVIFTRIAVETYRAK